MNRIAMLRKEHKISQKEFGSIIGVAQNTISNWENGNREPDFESLKKMASFFNCSTDYLLGTAPFGRTFVFGEDTDDAKKSPPPIGDGLSEVSQRFVGLIDKLTPNQQQLLLAQLQAWTEQNEQQAPAAQRSDGEKAPESDP